MKERFDQNIFLLLSTISGMIELGCVLLGINLHLSVLQIVGIGLAYQIGNLCPNPIKLNKTLTVVSSVLGLFCFLALYFTGFHYSLLFIGYVFTAITIQSLRSIQKSSISTSVKRSFRILGFCLAPLLTAKVNLALSVLLILIGLLTQFAGEKNRTAFLVPRVRFINMIMIVHQMHYFCYAYFILLIIANYAHGSLLVVAISFVLGWISYTSISHFLKRDTYFKYFVIGHFSLTVALFLLGFNTSNFSSILLWILTGFGGGTVFCIEKLNEITHHSSKSDITFSENIGHVLGVLAGMGAYWWLGELRSTVFLAAIFAATAMLGMLLYRVRLQKAFTSNGTIHVQ